MERAGDDMHPTRRSVSEPSARDEVFHVEHPRPHGHVAGWDVSGGRRRTCRSCHHADRGVRPSWWRWAHVAWAQLQETVGLAVVISRAVGCPRRLPPSVGAPPPPGHRCARASESDPGAPSPDGVPRGTTQAPAGTSITGRGHGVPRGTPARLGSVRRDPLQHVRGAPGTLGCRRSARRGGSAARYGPLRRDRRRDVLVELDVRPMPVPGRRYAFSGPRVDVGG